MFFFCMNQAISDARYRVRVDVFDFELGCDNVSSGAKYLYSVSYFHPRVGITGNENFNTPLYELLEKEHDIIVSTSKEKISAISASKKMSLLLDVEKKTPILKRERIVCDLGDRPVEYNIVYYRTDYFTYDIEIKRES